MQKPLRKGRGLGSERNAWKLPEAGNWFIWLTVIQMTLHLLNGSRFLALSYACVTFHNSLNSFKKSVKHCGYFSWQAEGVLLDHSLPWPVWHLPCGPEFLVSGDHCSSPSVSGGKNLINWDPSHLPAQRSLFLNFGFISPHRRDHKPVTDFFFTTF